MTISDQTNDTKGTTNMPRRLKEICPYIEVLIIPFILLNLPLRFIGNIYKPKSYKIENVCIAPDTAFIINGMY